MAHYDGSIKIDTKLDEKGVVNGLNGLKKIGVTAAKTLGAAAAATGTAMLAFGKQSIEAGMSFDSSMSQVAATMGTTVDQIQELRDFALEMGSKTAFSATQAADALNYMALAGYDAQTSMDMLPNVLNLAAAGGMELASASDMITDSQSALGLTLDETSMLVDKMAKASSKSNTSVSQLGEAILTVGGTAKNLAGGTTELATALGILADNGTKGAEGGTKLRNIILSLGAPTSDKAVKALYKLGVNAYDADGNMRPLQDTFADLNAAMADMTTAEKTDIINTIFNKTDIKDVNALLDTSVDRWNELSQAIDSGVSLGNVITDEGIVEMQQAFSKIYERLGDDTEAFSKEAKAYLEDAFDLNDETATSAINAFVESMQNGVTSADELQDALSNAGGAAQAMAKTQLDNLAGDITLFQSALEGAQIAVSDALSPALREFVQFGSQGVSELTEAFKSGDFSAVIDTFQDILTDGLNRLIEALPKFIDVGTDILLALVNGIVSALPTLGTAAIQIVSDLALALADAVPKLIPAAYEAIMGFLMALTDPGNLGALVDGAIALMIGLADGLIAALPILIENAPIIIENLVTALIENAPKLLDAALELVLALAEGLITNLPTILAAQWQIFTALMNGLFEFRQTLINWLLELGASIWNAIAEWFTDLIGGVGDWLSGLLDSLQAFLADLPNRVGYALGFVIGSLIKFGINAVNWVKTEVPKIISGIVTFFMQLPGKVAVWLKSTVARVIQFSSNMKTKAVGGAKDTVKGIIDSFTSLPGKLADIGGNIVKGLWKGINDMKNWVVDKVKGFSKSVLDGIKKALGINSPSKITTGYGGYLAQGLNLGFQKEMPKVRSALLGDIKSMTAGMRAVVSLESSRLAMNVSGGGNVTSSTVTNNTSYNPTLNFYQPVQSPAQTRRAIRKAMEVRG